MRKLTVGELFAGIGGIGLGLEMTGGFETVWQVENNSYARKVLAKHWPNARRCNDVRTFPCTYTTMGPVCHPDDWRVDVIAFGFPCQDISNAGKRAGLSGARSGLFFDALRVVGLLRPRWLVVENVAALLHRGMGTVVGELAALGYRVEWHCIPAAAVGAPHLRERVFICAHASSEHGGTRRTRGLAGNRARADQQAHWPIFAHSDAISTGLEKRQAFREDGGEEFQTAERMGFAVNANGKQAGSIQGGAQEPQGRWVPKLERRFVGTRGPWRIEPDVGRVADGVPARVDRLRCLGNAVVPQVAQWIGERILEAEL